MTGPAAVDVLVAVGTDHHPFSRLVAWVDAWAAAHPGASVLVQVGTSPAPVVADHVDYLEHDDLQRLISAASAVVCHGGPTTIAEVRRTGLVPLVVPRDPAHGEHVDEHQLRFVRRLVDRGLVHRADDQQHLTDLLDAALASPRPGGRAGAAVDDEVLATTAAFDEAVSSLFTRGRRGRRRRP